MHMLSKKVLSSDEMETLRRSRTPTRVVTANEAVQTHEQAQVFAYDLDLFVTVQILDDTSAVLSLRKLSEEHGYTYEWVSGHKPHLTKQEEEDFMQDGKSRTSCCPWIVVQFWYQFVLPQDSSSLSSTSPATERSDDPAPGNYRESPKNSKQKKEGLQSRLGRPIARPSRMVRGVHRKSRRYRLQRHPRRTVFIFTS